MNNRIEGLECRRLLASAVYAAVSKTLNVTGSEGDDQISVSLYNTGSQVYIGNQLYTFESPATHVNVQALGGDDNVSISSYEATAVAKTQIDRGGGNDQFQAFGRGVTVAGGTGNDTITGSADRDSLSGGDGNDLLDGSIGIDTVNGGSGTDTAHNDGIDSLVSIEKKIDARGSVQVTTDGTLLVQGTNGADNITLGGQSSPTLYLNDITYPLTNGSGQFIAPRFTRIELRGLGGDDRLGGYEPLFSLDPYPKFVLDGGSGNDDFVLQDFAASVIGGTGDDVAKLYDSSRLEGFSDSGGTDTIIATSWRPGGGLVPLHLSEYPAVENAIHSYSIFGNDLDNYLHLQGDWYDDDALLTGGKGNDTLVSTASGSIEGGDGNDRLFASSDRPTTVDGGTGVDTLYGGAAAAFVNGESVNPPKPANPVAFDTSGNVTITGTNGADAISFFTYRSERGEELDGSVIFNGVPFDLHYYPRTNFLINVNAKGGNDRIEMRSSAPGARAKFEGGNGNDTLIGGAYNDTLFGGNNDDTLDGRGGGDLMQGGGGSKDLVDYGSRSANLIIGIGTLADDGEAGEKDNVYNDVERVRGGKGNDKITGSAGANVLFGGNGNDTLLGGGGADALYGEAGNDSLDGGDANDYLDGGSGNDSLRGNAGFDSLFGWDGNDTFFSRDGNKETLHGGLGTDRAQRDASDILDSVETTIA